jgi:hypothetical protein
LLEVSDLTILIAGGNGIAVAWPLLVHHFLAFARSTDTEIAHSHLLRKKKIVLNWVVHQRSHLFWIDTGALDKAANDGIDVIIPPPSVDAGSPDLSRMIDDLVCKYSNEEQKKICAVASGPDSMRRLVRNTSARLVINGRYIDVMIEKFGW